MLFQWAEGVSEFQQQMSLKSFLDKYRTIILSTLFFLSGACSLLYQTVWLRLAFAHFGVITPVISVVISVFMMGLAIGSAGASRIAEFLQRKTGISSILMYGIAELIIACGAFLVPICFKLSSSLLLATGQTDSFSYLLFSACLLTACIILWTIAMGMTVPLALRFLQEFPNGARKGNFGMLYLANVGGALCGVAATLVFIETHGFADTLKIAMAANLLIFLVCFIWSFQQSREQTFRQEDIGSSERLLKTRNKIPIAILFSTGFVSMALELVWTRAFTPVLGTIVYSFATLLFVYLMSTCFGSLLYKLHLQRSFAIQKSHLVIASSFCSLLPLLLNDPRIAPANPASAVIVALLSIVPFCIVLGYLTPCLVDDISNGRAAIAGNLYAVNITGGIIGPLVAGYLLLPSFSVAQSMLLLAIPIFMLSFMFEQDAKRQAALAVPVILIFCVSSQCKSWEDGPLYTSGPYQVHRDYAATTVSWGSGMNKNLAVNGWKVTGLGNPTKMMAHIPLAYFSGTPKKALSICFGMGVTFLSELSWGINATAVELVPGVRKAFPFYFPAYAQLLDSNGPSQIVIDDGRRFLQRVDQKFDLIAVDPPPPPEAAGNSLLYSEEFYKLAKMRLSDGGIIHQMYPDWTEKNILAAVARSIQNSFRYVKVFRTDPAGIGFHFFASDRPFPQMDAEAMYQKMPASARADLCQFKEGGGTDCRPELASFLKGEIDIKEILVDDPHVVITDDRPYNEYFLLRRSKPVKFLDPRIDFASKAKN